MDRFQFIGIGSVLELVINFSVCALVDNGFNAVEVRFSGSVAGFN
jgi:hypothetical protein